MKIDLTKEEREELVRLIKNEYEGIDAGEFNSMSEYERYRQYLINTKNKLKVK